MLVGRGSCKNHRVGFPRRYVLRHAGGAADGKPDADVMVTGTSADGRSGAWRLSRALMGKALSVVEAMCGVTTRIGEAAAARVVNNPRRRRESEGRLGERKNGVE